jgi:hypothetical protein
MATLISIPILGLLLILQTAIISRITLINGTADLVLLAIIAWSLRKRVQTAWQWSVVGILLVVLVSEVPFYVPLIGYLAAVGISLLLRQRVWQVPILAMFIATFVSTLLIHTLTVTALRVSGVPILLIESLNSITLPSVILNLILAIPMYALMGELANLIYPEELTI